MSSAYEALSILQENILGSAGTTVGEAESVQMDYAKRNPTSQLDGDPFNFSTISYPRDITSNMANGHYMLFYVNVQNKTKYIYNPADGVEIKKEVEYRELIEGIEGTGDYKTKFVTYADTDATYREKLINKGAPGTILTNDGAVLSQGRKGITGFSNVLPTTRRITDSVALYLPPNVQDNLAATYSAAEMGVLGLAAAGGVDFVNAMRRNDFAAASKSLVGSAKGIIMEVAKNMGSELVGGLTGVDSQSIIGFANKAFGQATNPYMEVLYESMAMRTFTYNFTFQPRNQQETDDVQTIIKLFRFHMAPELQGRNERFLTLPSTFDIHYMYQMDAETATENNFYSKIATCVLTGVNVDYTPGAVKSFASGAPTQITMNLSFQETEMLTKQHIDRGY